MKPKRQESVPQEDLFRMRLEKLIDLCHPKWHTAKASNCARATQWGPQKQLQARRYAQTKQYKRMRGAIRNLRTWLGRVIRRHALTETGRNSESHQTAARPEA